MMSDSFALDNLEQKSLPSASFDMVERMACISQ